jgi:hypothetical protein
MPEMPDAVTNKKSYWWIKANYNGRLIVIGPKATEEEAYRTGYEKLECPFDVIELGTKDRAKATAHFKERRLEETGSLDLALKRAKHQ